MKVQSLARTRHDNPRNREGDGGLGVDRLAASQSNSGKRMRALCASNLHVHWRKILLQRNMPLSCTVSLL